MREGNPHEALKTFQFHPNAKLIIIIELFTLSDELHVLNLNHVYFIERK